jgi:hypothetical protein
MVLRARNIHLAPVRCRVSGGDGLLPLDGGGTGVARGQCGALGDDDLGAGTPGRTVTFRQVSGSRIAALQTWGQNRVIPLPIRTTPIISVITTATMRPFSSSQCCVDSSQPLVLSGATTVARTSPATVLAEITV